MTLQQLEYIVAVDKFKSFVQAADACNVTQSTLSSLIQKLENELDIVIFDRKSRPIRTTDIGEQMVTQAKIALFNVRQMKEMVQSERLKNTGEINICITPTIAPYITPRMFKYLKENYPKVKIRAHEFTRDEAIEKLKRAEVDVAILSLPRNDDDLLEIPLYKERFVMYVSPKSSLYNKSEIDMQSMPRDHLWGLKEEVNLQRQVPEICDLELEHSSVYEAGNIPTLMLIVDENGGFTTIPELHVNLLREEYQKNVRPLVNPELHRTVSIFVRKDYVRERMLNIIAESIKHIIPEYMLDEHIKKFTIKL